MSNPTLFLLFTLFFPLTLHSQYESGVNALKAQQYAEARAFFQKAGVKSPALEKFGLARYFAAKENPEFNLDSAYAYVLSGEQAYRKLEDRKKENLKEALKPDSPIRIKREIEKMCFNEAIERKNLQALDRLLSTIKNGPADQVGTATALRDQLAFEAAAAQNTMAGFDELLSKYGPSLRATNPALYQKAGMNLFEMYVKENGWEKQESFVGLYPAASFARDTVLASLNYAAEAASRNKIQGWESVVRRYRGTVFEAVGLDSLANYLVVKGDWGQCEQYLKSWPESPRKNKVWDKFYVSYRLKYPKPSDLKDFSTRFVNFPFPDRIKQDEAKALDYYFEVTVRSDSTDHAKYFLSTYPEYPRIDSVWYRYYALERAKAAVPEDIESFLTANPKYPAALRDKALQEKKDWEERIQRQTFEQLVSAGRPTPLLNYVLQQPAPKYAKEGQESLLEILLRSDSADAMRAFLTYFPDHKSRKKVLERLYVASRANRSLDGLDAFAIAYPDFDTVRIKNDRAGFFLSENLTGNYADDRWSVFSEYIRTFAPSDEAFWIFQKLIAKDYTMENWAAVKDSMVRYQSYFSQKNTAFNDLYKRLLDKGQPKKMLPFVWGDGKSYESYCPVFSGDEKQLYFCSRVNGTEDVFYSQLADSGWTAPVAISELNTPFNNEAPENISPNGTEMLLFVSGDIYQSKKTADGWQKPAPLPNTINTSAWDGDSRFFGRGLIYVSGKEGNSDIYISLYGADGSTLQEPFSVGNVVNSWRSERNPFLHPDMKTLYFASDGHDGLGGFDIYVSTRLDDTWKNWSKPRNLGLVFNSTAADWYFVVSTNGKRAYSVFYDGRENHITYIDLPEAYQPAPVFTFETKVFDADGNPAEGEIVIQDIQTGQIVQIVRPDPLTGAVFIPVSEKKNYRAELRKPGAPPVSLQLNFAQDTASRIVEQPVVLSTTEELKRSGASMVLNNLFFETGSYTILGESRLELDALSKYLMDDNLSIEIQGHTDDVGNPERNQLLSENRAGAVREYLISKGCKAENIKAAGYGESRPTIAGKDEKSRQKNRRVEFKLL